MVEKFLNHKVEKFKYSESFIEEIVFGNKKKISLNKDDVIISSLPIN